MLLTTAAVKWMMGGPLLLLPLLFTAKLRETKTKNLYIFISLEKNTYVASQSFNIEISILPLYVNLLGMESNLTKFGALALSLSTSLSIFIYIYIGLYYIECGIYTQKKVGHLFLTS